MKKIIKRVIMIIAILTLVLTVSVITFFKTDIFAKYRDLWVQTAMNTSSHQYLATWFLTDEEIDDILSKYQVTNSENSSGNSVTVKNTEQKIQVEKISGSTYKGYAVTIADPTALSLINTVENSSGTKLSETAKETGAIVAMNAGGFDMKRNGSSSLLNSLTIIDEELLYGDENETYSIIGFTKTGVLKLGNYTYQEAIEAGIDDAISFGPFLIVDGKTQIKETSTGGLQPRSAIGQKKDGTIIFLVIEGRSTTSKGATLYDLQEIMEEYGAYNAANLDGGGSSALYYKGSLINVLSNGEERSIPNALIVT